MLRQRIEREREKECSGREQEGKKNNEKERENTTRGKERANMTAAAANTHGLIADISPRLVTHFFLSAPIARR